MSFHSIQKGSPIPLGTTITEKGVNFAIFSRHATSMVLCLLAEKADHVVREIALDPHTHRTGDVWHIFLEELKLPLLYAYKIDGPHKPPHGFRPERLLVDPYATQIVGPQHWGKHNSSYQLYGKIDSPQEFDWEEINPPCLDLKDLVIYEMHVRGFTQDSSSCVQNPGSYLGVVEKIPYLLDLGINAIELMPVFEFNECENNAINPKTKEKLFNYWGYSSTHFFSPMIRYAAGHDADSQIIEFKKMIKELHRHGIEVILDVVFNHTGEKGNQDSVISFLGIDRSCYYLLSGGKDTNYTGCGNTFNMNHPMVREFIVKALRYWVSEMHIDGFRFDLASVMNRDMKGKLLSFSPLLQSLSLDPVLAKTKLIAEPWDASGAYQLGGFFSDKPRWSEWNGKYRDVVRQFIKGDFHSKNAFADCLGGSQGIFSSRSPQASINFITSHDGFSLADLVAYQEKKNEENGEENRDGNNYNINWNCGVEGITEEKEIIAIRLRQMKNFILALFISQGVPMIIMGDEYAHTRYGNNNPWCQDNKLNWFLWDELEKKQNFYRFVKKVIQLRHHHSILKKNTFLKEEDIVWHGINPGDPNWEGERPILAFTLINKSNSEHLYVAFNATVTPIDMILPPILEKNKSWHVIIDTYADAPYDIVELGKEKKLSDSPYCLQPYSSILLKAL